MKILIVGDSFAVRHTNSTSWTRLLENEFVITNIAQAGISEYKIYKQLQSAVIEDYNFVIVSHTSPYRVHTKNHPTHKFGSHKNCDLIFNDIESKFSWFNPSLRTAKNWFRYHYDEQYQIDTYKLIRQEIKRIITIPCLNIDNLDIPDELISESLHLDLRKVWPIYRGDVNHYNRAGNVLLYKKIIEIIKNEFE